MKRKKDSCTLSKEKSFNWKKNTNLKIELQTEVIGLEFRELVHRFIKNLSLRVILFEETVSKVHYPKKYKHSISQRK